MGGLDNCDPAMLDLFRAEMDAHVPVLSQGLLALEKGRADEKDLEAMMRAAHSIKGAARIVGIEAAVRVAHKMEDCFSAAQAQRVSLDSEAVDVLLQGVDALQRICSPQPDATVTEESLQDLVDRIAAIREGKPAPPQRRAEEAPVAPVAVQPTPYATQSPGRRLALPEVFDASAAESLRGELSGILQQEPARIVLDFAPVRHVSAAALSLLASLARELTRPEAATTIDVEGASAPITALLRTTGLDSAFKRSR